MGASVVYGVVSLVSAAATAYVSVEAKKKAKAAANAIKNSRSSDAQKQMFKNAVAAKQIVMGHSVLSGPMVFACEEGSPNDAGEGEWLHIVVHIAGHVCDDVTHVWLDDSALIREPSADGADIRFRHSNGLGNVYIYLGEHGANGAPATLRNLPDWDDNMIGEGQCFAHIKLKSDPSKWPGGIPNPKFAVRGLKVFDPRTNQTVWTDNPALLVRWYRNELKQGVALDDAYITAANVCDETVATPEGEEKRYRCNYSFMADQRPRKTLDVLRATCDGLSLRVAGRHAFQVGAYYGPGVVTIGEDDILEDISITPDVRRRDRINTVSATYTDPDSNWNEVDMPRVVHEAYREQDGYDIVEDLDLTAVSSPYQAQRLALINILTVRNAVSIELTCNLRATQLLPGTVFRLDFPENEWHGVEFKVGKWKYANKGAVTLTAKQTMESHYTWNKSTAIVPTRPGMPQLIDHTQVELVTNLQYITLSDSNTLQAVITWDHRSYGGVTYELTFFQNGSLLRRVTTVDKQYRLQDGFTVGQYEVQVVAINGYEQRSPVASLAFSAAAPVTPIGVDITAGNWNLELKPISAGIVNFDTMYDFALGFDANTQDEDLEQYQIGRAKVITVNNLKADTVYQIAVREVSRWGFSSWYRTIAQTTFNSDDVLEIINGQISQEHLNEGLNDFLTEVDERSNATEQQTELALLEIADLTNNIELINSDVLKNIDDIERIDIDIADISKNLAQVSTSNIQVKDLQSQLSQSVLQLSSGVSAMQQEYQRRLLLGEAMIGAVAMVDPDTGKIVNLAFNYADQKFTQAGLEIDGVKASVTIQAQEINRVEQEAGSRLTEAEAAIQINAGLISQKASYNEVSEIVSGAIDAITPAKSWQFNTSAEGWSGATWQSGGYVSGSAFSIGNLGINAADNPIVRIRAMATSPGTLSWNGGSQNVAVRSPSIAGEFETLIINLTEADGWSGVVDSLEINFDATLDFVEVGKPSAAEQALNDIRARTTQIEEVLDPANARWELYVTQEYWDNNALTLSDVTQQIDAFEAEWQVAATFQALSDNETIEKANSAQSWVNAAQSNITNIVVAYNAQPGGIDDQLSGAADQLTTAQQQISALEGSVSQTVTSITDVENALNVDPQSGLNAIMGAYQDFVRTQGFQKQQVGLAYAEQKIQANSNQIESQAQSLLELGAIQGEHTATLSEFRQSIARQDSALSLAKDELQAQIEAGDENTLAAASQVTSQAFANAEEARSETESQLQAQIEFGDENTLAAANQVTSQAFTNAEEARSETESRLQAQIEAGDENTLAAANQVTSQAFANAEEARSETESQLQAQIEFGDENTLAAANQVTSQAFANAEEARSETESRLQAQIVDGDENTLAAANQTTSEAFANAEEARSQTETRLQTQVFDARNDLSEQALGSPEDVLQQYKLSLRSQDSLHDRIALGYARQRLTAHSDQLSAQSENIVELLAAKDEQQAFNRSTSEAFANAEEARSQTESQLKAQIEFGDENTLAAANQVTSQAFANAEEARSETESQLQAQIEFGDENTLAAANQTTSQAFASAQQALTETESQLQAQIENGDENTLAAANEYTRAAVGYCIDSDGNITSETNAVACIAVEGNSWVDGPLAEFIRNLQVQHSNGQSASISQMMQVFENVDGNLVARGGVILNNQGRVTGLVSTNDGETTSLDIITQYLRLGDEDESGNFSPTLYVDSESGKLVLRGRLVLDDGEMISSRDELKGADGTNGVDGSDGQDGADGLDGKPGTIWGTLRLRGGIFPSDTLATSDFTSRYGRAPQLDDMLTYVSNDETTSSVKAFDGQSWVIPGLRLNGNLITPGSIYGDRIVAGSEISSPVIIGGEVRGGHAKFGPNETLSRGYNTVITEAGLIETNNLKADGGEIDNLVVGENCTVLSTLTAGQIIGDVARPITVNVTSYQQVQVNRGQTQYIAMVTELDLGATSWGRNVIIPAGILFDDTQGAGDFLDVILNGQTVYTYDSNNTYRISSSGGSMGYSHVTYARQVYLPPNTPALLTMRKRTTLPSGSNWVYTYSYLAQQGFILWTTKS